LEDQALRCNELKCFFSQTVNKDRAFVFEIEEEEVYAGKIYALITQEHFL
jgi:hypothetical protein